MKIKKAVSFVLSAVLAIAFLSGGIPVIKPIDKLFSEIVVVSAEEAADTQYEADIIYMVIDEYDEKGNYCQWYRTSDERFRTSGINIKLNGEDITYYCKLSFRKNVTPANYYNKNSFEYEVPIDVCYDGETTVTTSLPVMIGQDNDANLDHSVDVRDAALIARHAARIQDNQKGLMSDFAKFLVTGTRSINSYIYPGHAASIAQNLAREALNRASGKKIENQGNGDYSLSLSKANGLPGETITIQVVVDADDNFESLDALIEWDNRTLGSAAAVAVNGTLCASYADNGMLSVVDYGNGIVEDGAIASIDFTIPEDARPGTNFELYFSDIKNFSVINGEQGNSVDVKNLANISGAQISVNAPKSTTAPAITTAATTSNTTSTVTAATTDKSVTTTPNKSTAQTTAVAATTSSSTNGSTTTATTKATTVFTVTILRGDANLDGKVNIKDAVHIARAIATRFVDMQLTVSADFNLDGNINIKDSLEIARYLANIRLKKTI